MAHEKQSQLENNKSVFTDGKAHSDLLQNVLKQHDKFEKDSQKAHEHDSWWTRTAKTQDGVTNRELAELNKQYKEHFASKDTVIVGHGQASDGHGHKKEYLFVKPNKDSHDIYAIDPDTGKPTGHYKIEGGKWLSVKEHKDTDPKNAGGSVEELYDHGKKVGQVISNKEGQITHIQDSKGNDTMSVRYAADGKTPIEFSSGSPPAAYVRVEGKADTWRLKDAKDDKNDINTHVAVDRDSVTFTDKKTGVIHKYNGDGTQRVENPQDHSVKDFNSAGQLTHERFAGGKEVNIGYNDAGVPVSFKDEHGKVWTKPDPAKEHWESKTVQGGKEKVTTFEGTLTPDASSGTITWKGTEGTKDAQLSHIYNADGSEHFQKHKASWDVNPQGKMTHQKDEDGVETTIKYNNAGQPEYYKRGDEEWTSKNGTDWTAKQTTGTSHDYQGTLAAGQDGVVKWTGTGKDKGNDSIHTPEKDHRDLLGANAALDEEGRIKELNNPARKVSVASYDTVDGKSVPHAFTVSEKGKPVQTFARQADGSYIVSGNGTDYVVKNLTFDQQTGEISYQTKVKVNGSDEPGLVKLEANGDTQVLNGGKILELTTTGRGGEPLIFHREANGLYKMGNAPDKMHYGTPSIVDVQPNFPKPGETYWRNEHGDYSVMQANGVERAYRNGKQYAEISGKTTTYLNEMGEAAGWSIENGPFINITETKGVFLLHQTGQDTKYVSNVQVEPNGRINYTNNKTNQPEHIGP